MEHKLDMKTLAVSFLAGVGVLLGVMVCGALVGVRTPSPQSVELPSAVLAVILSGVVMGVLCARYLSESPIVHSVLCALAMTLIICLASLRGENNSSFFGMIIPTLSLLIPPVAAYLTTPKNNSKRKLKRLGVKL